MKRLSVLVLLAAMAIAVFSTVSAEKKYTIAGIVFQEDQFMQTVLAGMRDVAEKNGVELLTANTANNISKEVEVINTYIARGVDAICITTLDPNAASIPALRQAAEKGIKIICFNNALAADFPVSTIMSSNESLGGSSGKAAAEYIKTKLKGQKIIRVGIMNYRAQLPPESDARQNGFWKEIVDLPGVILVAEQSSPLVDQAQKKAGDIITANPNLDIFYGCNDGGTKGCVLAVKNAKKKIAVFGIDVDKQMCDWLLSKDNILQAVTGQNPFLIGSMSIQFALKALKGETVEKRVIVPGITLSRADLNAVQTYYNEHFK